MPVADVVPLGSCALVQGFPLLLNILTKYPHVPEVELKAVDVMWQLMYNVQARAIPAQAMCTESITDPPQ